MVYATMDVEEAAAMINAVKSFSMGYSFLMRRTESLRRLLNKRRVQLNDILSE